MNRVGNRVGLTALVLVLTVASCGVGSQERSAPTAGPTAIDADAESSREQQVLEVGAADGAADDGGAEPEGPTVVVTVDPEAPESTTARSEPAPTTGSDPNGADQASSSSTASSQGTASSQESSPSTSPPARSVAYRGVTPDQWSEINARRSGIGDPNDCRARVESIAVSADVTVWPGDDAAIRRAIESGARVVELGGGTHSIDDTIRLDAGQQLIGADGQDVVIRASGVRRGVELDNGAVLSNVAVLGADDEGVVLRQNSLVHRVSIGRTGYGDTYNENGTGLMVTKGGANNCIVSAEVFEGFNEGGAPDCPACANGGNADGISITFGATDNTIIDTHAYRNSDDGYDFWQSGTTFVYFGSAFDNGKIPGRPAGDGNGFKLGRGDATHHLYKAVARSNQLNGFDLNGNARPAVLVQTESSGNGGRDYVDVGNG